MTAIIDKANEEFRDKESPGAAAYHWPEKVGIRELFALIDIELGSLGVNGAITVKKATKALLDADLAHIADTLAVVYNDSTSANNGIYAKVGGSGSGSWVITALALPASFADDLAEVMAKLEAIDGNAIAAGYVEVLGELSARAGLYGIADASDALGFGTLGSEALFSVSEYRVGLDLPTNLPSNLPDWTFTRALAGWAINADAEAVAFASGVPRILGDVGVLIEPAATNILLRSTDPANAAWIKGSGTVTNNFGTAPDGTTTAHKFAENTDNAAHYFQQIVAGLVATTVYNHSLYVKANGRDKVFVREGVGGGQYISVQLTGDGVVLAEAGGAVATIEALANGWYRVDMTFALSGTSGAFQITPYTGESLEYAGDGTSGILFWSPQWETGIRPTSPVVTVASAVTRPADRASYDVTSSTTSGAFFVDAIIGRLSAETVVIAEWSDESEDNRLVLTRTSDDNITLSGAADGETLDPVVLSAAEDGMSARIGVLWDGGVFRAWVNGTASGEITVAGPPSFTKINVGADYTGGAGFGGYVKRVATFPTPPSAAAMTRMTLVQSGSAGTARLIAASDSSPEAQALADVICDGVDDQVQINPSTALAGTTTLFDGTYHVSATDLSALDLPLAQGEVVATAITLTASGSTLQGQSRMGTIIRLADDQDCNVIRTIGDGLEGIQVQSLTVDQNAANNTITGSDWLEQCGIKTRTTGEDIGGVRNSDIEIYDVHFKRALGVGLYLFGNNVHARNCTFEPSDADAAELCDGSVGSITHCRLVVRSGETGGFGFGTDAFDYGQIDNNTILVEEGGTITGAACRLWANQYGASCSHNNIVCINAVMDSAILAWGFNTKIVGNTIRGGLNLLAGRTKIEINTTTVFTGNSAFYCKFITSGSSAVGGGSLPTDAAGDCMIVRNILENCEAPGVHAQTIFEDNVEYTF